MENDKIPEGFREAPLTWLDKWFIKWHGIGDGHQAMLYRCVGCRRIMTHTSISRGMCGCGINKVTATNPSWFELLRLYLLPWTVK